MEVILDPLLLVLILAVNFYYWVVIVGVIMSWLVAFNVINTSNRFVYMVGDFCHRLTEPAAGPIRRALPNLGGVDLSPLIVIFALIFLERFLNNLRFSLISG